MIGKITFDIKKDHPVTGWSFLLIFRHATYTIAIAFCALSAGCSERYRNRKTVKTIINCQKTWTYFTLDHPIKGIVLAHSKGICSYANISANTLIITETYDTIRVIEPCYNEILAIADSVLIIPSKKDGEGTLSDLKLKYECTVKRTCYGVVSIK